MSLRLLHRDFGDFTFNRAGGETGVHKMLWGVHDSIAICCGQDFQFSTYVDTPKHVAGSWVFGVLHCGLWRIGEETGR